MVAQHTYKNEKRGGGVARGETEIDTEYIGRWGGREDVRDDALCMSVLSLYLAMKVRP